MLDSNLVPLVSLPTVVSVANGIVLLDPTTSINIRILCTSLSNVLLHEDKGDPQSLWHEASCE